MVAEKVTWFKERGTNPIDINLKIMESSKYPKEPKNNFENFDLKLVWYVKKEPEISFCSLLADKILEGNFLSWRFNSISVSGFSAGAGYPQIWIRDSATIMPVARYTHSKSELTSWIKAHLSIQENDGALQDWIMGNGEYDKNTVESDQESSIVIAAYEISKSIGYDWLSEEINSKSILLRLSDALNYLFLHRLDSYTGLIKSGHTADWGDVSNEFSDQRATDLHKNSNEVVGIYTNSMGYGAAKSLSYLFYRTGSTKKADYWNNKATLLMDNIQTNLWQDDRGFFRIHNHVNFEHHANFDEKNIFPMGGNAVAIEMGAANQDQTDRIISQASKRQKLFNFSTISGVLLPPYPKGFFVHPILDDYFEYQNGGQWDWFGGRLVLQMFLHEFPDALLKSREICRKAVENKGYFEWDSMDGKGNGSSHFAGSAAIVSRMIIEGLFGVNWTTDGIIIKPRLGTTQGYIYIPQKESSKFISYNYEPSLLQQQNKYRIKLSLGSNSTLPKTIILLKKYKEFTFSSVKNYSRTIATKYQVKGNMVLININDTPIELTIEYEISEP